MNIHLARGLVVDRNTDRAIRHEEDGKNAPGIEYARFLGTGGKRFGPHRVHDLLLYDSIFRNTDWYLIIIGGDLFASWKLIQRRRSTPQPIADAPVIEWLKYD